MKLLALPARFASIALATIPALGIAQATLPQAQYQAVYDGAASDGTTNGTARFSGAITTSGPVGRVIGSSGSEATTLVGVSPNPDPAVSVYSTVTASGFNMSASVQIAGSTSDPFGIEAGSGNALMSYGIEFIGPTATVPIQVSAFIEASLSALPQGALGDNIVEAGVRVGSPTGLSFQDRIYIDAYNFGGGYSSGASQAYKVDSSGARTSLSYTDAGYFGSINDNHVWLAQTNTTYTVRLEANQLISSNGSYLGGSLAALSYVDPTFQIAATDPSAYSILLSPDVGNSSVAAVPEPSTVAMFTLGLGFLIATRRRTLGVRTARRDLFQTRVPEIVSL